MEKMFNLENKKGIASYKRIAEYCMMVPGFKEELKVDKESALSKYGLETVTQEDKEAYEEFVKVKLAWRERHKESCAPDNSRMKKWRQRQMDRCKLSFPDAAAGNVHIPITYELSSGCSVGCEFCGVGARGLQAVYKYNDDNVSFFKDILEVSKKVIGDASKHAALYFATEPLDNPDYEKFSDIFVELNDQLPQVTTAVPIRNIDRTRKLISRVNETSNMFYRFSVRSLDIFYELMANFTAEELLFVELLPQFNEAPGNMFVKAGRSLDDDGIETSISCISGFLVNMCDKTVKLTTPVIASKEHPEGMVILLNEKFNTVSEYEGIITRAIAEEIKTVIEPDEKLKIYSWFEYKSDDENVGIVAKNGSGLLVKHSQFDTAYEYTYEMLKAGNYTRKEIGEMVIQKLGIRNPITIYSLINKMWNMGFIYDESVYGLRKE